MMKKTIASKRVVHQYDSSDSKYVLHNAQQNIQHHDDIIAIHNNVVSRSITTIELVVSKNKYKLWKSSSGSSKRSLQGNSWRISEL